MPNRVSTLEANWQPHPTLVSDQILCVFDPGSLFHALDFLRLAT